MAEGPKKILKILCVHGYRQSGKIFQNKTGSFRKALKKLPLEFVYITAPNKVPNTEEEDQYGWWFSTEENTYDPFTNSLYCKGYELTLKYIEEVFQTQGPFDGIFAFSQGASFASLLCAMNDQPESVVKFNFAILVAGFKSRSSLHDVFYENILNCPALHVYGENDQVIPIENSVKLSEFFKDPVILCHPGGHFVPASSQYRPVYVNFLERFC